MARQPRLALTGAAHYVLQRGHNGGLIVRDDDDRRSLLAIVRDAAHASDVLLQAYGVRGDELHLLVVPADGGALGRLMQAVGRRHAAVFNRRHQRSGALWDGRYRSAIVEPGDHHLTALRLIDAIGLDREPAEPVADELASSAGHRIGGRRDPGLVDPPEYWRLGNTPFERELRYRALLAEPLPPAVQSALERALRGAWVFGSPEFSAHVARQSGRPASPRPRGRPRRAA